MGTTWLTSKTDITVGKSCQIFHCKILYYLHPCLELFASCGPANFIGPVNAVMTGITLSTWCRWSNVMPVFRINLIQNFFNGHASFKKFLNLKKSSGTNEGEMPDFFLYPAWSGRLRTVIPMLKSVNRTLRHPFHSAIFPHCVHPTDLSSLKALAATSYVALHTCRQLHSPWTHRRILLHCRVQWLDSSHSSSDHWSEI